MAPHCTVWVTMKGNSHPGKEFSLFSSARHAACMLGVDEKKGLLAGHVHHI